jgi:uncharacterized metal-binding protein
MTMSDSDEYPLATLHKFLQEASTEFNRFRTQAKVNLIGSIILLLFLSRFLIFVFVNVGPPPFNLRPFHREEGFDFDYADLFLLFASLVAVLWSLNVWIRQRKFVSRWGERFEKLDSLEKQLLPDEKD